MRPISKVRRAALRRIVVVATILALVPSVAGAQTSDLRADLDEVADVQQRAEQRLEDITAREDVARATLSAASQALDAAEADLAELDRQLDSALRALTDARAAAQDARDGLAEVEAERAAAEQELGVQREQLDARVRAAFKYGQVSFLDAFVGTADIAEFLNSSTYLGNVLEADRLLVDEVSRLLGIVEEQRAEAHRLRRDAEAEAQLADAAASEVARATREQAHLTDVLAERRAEHARALQALGEDRTAVESHLAGLEAEGQRIADQLAQIARQQAREQARQAAAADDAARRAAATEGGRWVRPVTGAVTSAYGPRWGRNHNGVDLSGALGSQVSATRGGVVVIATTGCHPTSSFGCGGGFGNYVTIAHPDGLASIYAHLSTVAVGVGQVVDAGQVIGGVGNSGSSYGAHLHFEVRHGGAPLEPCAYIGC